MRRFRVWLHTAPSPGSTYYDGYVDVVADDETDARERAVRQLVRVNFRDYPASAFRVDKVESR